MINRVMTWVLILALLVSQSYAYASVPCESNGSVTSQHHSDMDSMDHSQEQEFAMDCCDQECSCPTGACASVTLTHDITATSLQLVSDSSVFYLFSIPDAFLPSLRKPPIIG